MTTELDGKVVWVTGAGKGLGRSIAAAFANAADEITVVATSRTSSDLEDLKSECPDGSIVVAAGSVGDKNFIDVQLNQILYDFGTIDVLINCAGISPIYQKAESVSHDDWQHIIDVNVTGTFLMCRAVGKEMIAQGTGSIVNVSSIHGQVGAERIAPYATSKGAVEALTKALAVEWAGRGVRVNAVAPGYYYTALSAGLLDSPRGQAIVDRVPLGRLGEPRELASAVLFLAGGSSSYMTGSVINVDGGWTAQ